MMSTAAKIRQLIQRKRRIRAKVSGTAERPRLSVSVSNRLVSAQLIDDAKGRTLAASQSRASAAANLSEQAQWVGADIAKKAKKAKVTRVVFDRNGRKYHGRLKRLAEAAREQGLEF
jgi:large subunit ribosomal protein L18